MRKKSLHYLIFVICIVSQLFGCTIMKTKQDLKRAELRQENIVLRGNYQALLKCWDDNAEKQTIDFVNQTISQIYPDLGIAEILLGGADGTYAVIIELKRETADRTIVNAYGTGYLGAQRLPEWLDVLRSCQPEMP